MRSCARIHACALLLLSFLSIAVLGQTTTSTLVGTVTSSGSPLPGVTVTISSPRLQGVRTAVTTETGAFQFLALPPGDYQVKFTLEGMQDVTRSTELRLQETSRVDADLAVSAVSEAITVTADAPAVDDSSQVTTNLSAELIENLPVRRSITERLRLAPGVSTGGPNGQTIIGGAPSWQNLYLVNGVVVNENLRGQPHGLFIEDAIEETSILQGGASAEYGRFTGGIISTITKSGGNEFSGSLRENFVNDSWTTPSDYRNAITGVAETPRVDKLNPVYEGTLGGRIIRDRLWFFTAARYAETSAAAQTTETDIPFTRVTENTRLEGKLTAQLLANHNIVASYLDVDNIEGNNYFDTQPIVDLRSVIDRQTPNTLMAVHYSGIFGPSLLLEAQYSEKKFAFLNSGAKGTDLINDTLVIDVTNGWRGWSPTFGGAEAKRRDNEDLLFKGSYFLSTSRFGNHSIVGGVDQFHDLRRENNYQSGSNYRVYADMIVQGDDWWLSLDPDSAPYFFYQPVSTLSRGADFETSSAFLNDRWEINSRWSGSLGLRYDRNHGLDEEHNEVANDSRFSPRLGLTFDPHGDGRYRFNASYGNYVAIVDSNIGNSTSGAGTADTYVFNYLGPAINAPGTPVNELLPTDEVLRRMFAWFDSVGGLNADRPVFDQAVIGGETTGIDGTLRSPYMDELSLGFAMRVGANGFVRADAIHREWGDFFVTYQNTSLVRTIDGERVDFALYGNADNDDLQRRYDGLQFQGQYRLFNRFDLGGNYTWSRLRGNVEGENATSGTVASTIYSYPEYRDFAQHNPIGYLAGDVRHRANVWLSYGMELGRGRVNAAVLERFHSGMPYSAAGSIDLRAGAVTGPADGIVNPGYNAPPSTVAYVFGERGQYRADDIASTDFSLNYSIPVFGVDLFFKGDVTNAFNQQGVEDPRFINTAVRTRANGARFPVGRQFGQSDVPGAAAAAFNPETTTPVEYVYGVSDPNGTYHFAKDINFGKPTSRDAYQEPRTYRFALGLRF